MGKNTSISLGNHFEEFINEEVKSGRYSSVSEVIRSALRLLECEEKKEGELIKALEIGEESGFVDNIDPKTKSCRITSGTFMSKNEFRISKQAIDDLNDIWFYTFSKWSKEQADRYYNLIIGEIEFIADNFPIGKSAEQVRTNYRVKKIKSYLIFYRKVEDEIIEIVRILHQRMDFKKRLK